jgi:hypothetical protein
MQSYPWLAPVMSRAERKAVLVSLGQQCGMMRWSSKAVSNSKAVTIYYLASSEVATLQLDHLF